MLQITIFLSNYSNFIRKRKKKKTKSMVLDEYLNDIKHEGGRRGRGEDLRWGQPDKEWIGRDCFYAKASNGCHFAWSASRLPLLHGLYSPFLIVFSRCASGRTRILSSMHPSIQIKCFASTFFPFSIFFLLRISSRLQINYRSSF